jgi:hypothetical protein
MYDEEGPCINSLHSTCSTQTDYNPICRVQCRVYIQHQLNTSRNALRPYTLYVPETARVEPRRIPPSPHRIHRHHATKHPCHMMCPIGSSPCTSEGSMQHAIKTSIKGHSVMRQVVVAVCTVSPSSIARALHDVYTA